MNALAVTSDMTALEAKRVDLSQSLAVGIAPRSKGTKHAAEIAAQSQLLRTGFGPTPNSSPDENIGKIISIGRANMGSSVVSLEPLQEWEGYVISVSNDHFSARLVDKTLNKTIEEEIADFPLEEVRDVDQPLLKEGAVFRWVIGYLRQASGMKMRASQIVFRRMPAWTALEIKNARIEAKLIIDGIVWE